MKTTTKLLKKVAVAFTCAACLLSTSATLSAQAKPKKPSSMSWEDTVYDSSELTKAPEFPGGINGLYSFIGKTYRVPKIPGNMSEKVIIRFIVEPDGTLSNYEIVKDAGYGTGKEAIRTMKLSPKWQPGELNTKPVRVKCSMPILIKN